MACISTSMTRTGHVSRPCQSCQSKPFWTALPAVSPECHSWHLHANAYNIDIATNKDCMKYSFFPRTIIDWNSLPEPVTKNISSYSNVQFQHFQNQLGTYHQYSNATKEAINQRTITQTKQLISFVHQPCPFVFTRSVGQYHDKTRQKDPIRTPKQSRLGLHGK